MYRRILVWRWPGVQARRRAAPYRRASLSIMGPAEAPSQPRHRAKPATIKPRQRARHALQGLPAGPEIHVDSMNYSMILISG